MPTTATPPSHIAALETPKPVTAVALAPDGILVIGSGSNLIVPVLSKNTMLTSTGLCSFHQYTQRMGQPESMAFPLLKCRERSWV